jgi:hypothetical protein
VRRPDVGRKDVNPCAAADEAMPDIRGTRTIEFQTHLQQKPGSSAS